MHTNIKFGYPNYVGSRINKTMSKLLQHNFWITKVNTQKCHYSEFKMSQFICKEISSTLNRKWNQQNLFHRILTLAIASFIYSVGSLCEFALLLDKQILLSPQAIRKKRFTLLPERTHVTTHLTAHLSKRFNLLPARCYYSWVIHLKSKAAR